VALKLLTALGLCSQLSLRRAGVVQGAELMFYPFPALCVQPLRYSMSLQSSLYHMVMSHERSFSCASWCRREVSFKFRLAQSSESQSCLCEKRIMTRLKNVFDKNGNIISHRSHLHLHTNTHHRVVDASTTMMRFSNYSFRLCWGFILLLTMTARDSFDRYFC